MNVATKERTSSACILAIDSPKTVAWISGCCALRCCPWHQIHYCEHPPQNRLVSTNAINHRGIEALLIERLMHQLEIHQLFRLTRWTQHTKNPWLLVNQLVAIQPGISTTGQPRWFLLVSDTV